MTKRPKDAPTKTKDPKDPAEEDARGRDKAKLEVESLEPRIMLSATWVDADTGDAIDGPTNHDDSFTGTSEADEAHGGRGDDILEGLGGADALFGDAGDDLLQGGAGADILEGGRGSDILDGGSGFDTADYSGSNSEVTVDLTVGTVEETGQDSDTLIGIERVIGSSRNDTFAFSAPADGATYTIDGGGGSNTLDFSNFDRSDASFENGSLTVQLEGGGSFTVEHDNIDTVQFGDKTVNFAVWDADTGNSDWTTAANWSNNQPPGADDIVVFDGSSDHDVVIGEGTRSVGGILISADYDGDVHLQGDLTVEGDLDIESGSFQAGSHSLEIHGDLHVDGGSFEASSETTIVTGDVSIQSGSFEHNSGQLVLAGTGDQSFEADGVTLDDFKVDKAGGTLTIHQDLEIRGDFTVAAGAVDATASTIEFTGHGNTISAGDAQLGNVVMNVDTVTIDGSLDVEGDLSIEKMYRLEGGDLHVAGNVTSTDTSYSGSGTVVLDGDGNQTVGANGGSGELHHLRVEKDAGSVTLQDHVQLSGDVTVVSGSFDAMTATVEFQGHGNTIAVGDAQFGDVIFNADTVTIDGSLDVDGDMTISKLYRLEGGDVHVSGDVTTTDTSYSGSGAVVLDGSGDQTIAANGGTGELHHLRVEKGSGSVTLQDHVQLSGDVTVVAGELDPSAATVEFQGHGNTIAVGDTQFGDVVFKADTVNIDGDLDIDGDLTISKLYRLEGGDLHVSGDVTTTDTSYSGSGSVVLDGSGDQTVGANGGTGELHHLRVEKDAGSVTLQDHVQLSGDVTVVSGSLDPSAATVEFQGHGNTIAVGDTQFGDVVFKADTVTIDGDLDVDGDLTISKLYRLEGGDVHVSGDVTTTDTSYSGSGSVVLDGSGDQTVGANGGTGELHHLRVEKDGGTATLQDHVQLSGDVTVVSGSLDPSAATVEFQGHGNTIAVGDTQFGDVVFKADTVNIDGDLDVDGDLTISKLYRLEGGDVHVSGDVTTTDTSYSGSGSVVLDGSGDQTVGANGGTGELHDLRVEKDGGTATLQDHVQLSGDLTVVSGSLDPSAATVEFQGHGNTIAAGDTQFGDVIFNADTLVVDGVMEVEGDLTIQKLYRLESGVVHLTGELELIDENFSGSGRIVQDDLVSVDCGVPTTTHNVLDNELEASGQDLSIDSFTQPEHGTVTSNDDGTFAYTSEDQYSGEDSFTYTAIDESGQTSTATVTVIVSEVATQFLEMTPAEIGELTTEQVENLCPATIASLDSYQTLELVEHHTEDLTVEQLNSIGHDRLGNVDMTRLSVEQFDGLDADHLNDLKSNQFGDLSGEQLETLTPERIEDLDSYRSLYVATEQTENLTVEQLNSIGHDRLGNVDMTRLSVEQFDGLDADHLNDLKSNQFGDLSGEQLETLTPERIEDLDSYRSLYLATEQTENLTVEQLNSIGHDRLGNVDMTRMSVEQFDGLDAEHLNDLKSNQFGDLSGEQLETLTPERIEDLDSYRSLYLATEQTENLTVEQLNSIGHDRLGNVDMTRLSVEQFDGLDAEHLNDLKSNQFGDLSGEQLETLTPERIDDLDSYRSLYLATEQTENLTVEQLNSIGHDRLGNVDMTRMSVEQFDGLDAEHLNDLKSNQFGDLSGEQLETLTPERIEDLDSYRSLYLATEQTENMTVEQLNSIGHDRLGNVDMTRLSVEQFDGLDAEHLNDLQSSQFGDMSAEQLETLEFSVDATGESSIETGEQGTLEASHEDRIGQLDSYRSLYLATEQTENLTVEQLNSIGHGRLGNVDMTRLSTEQFDGLDADHLNDLKSNQFADLSGEQVATLTPERIGQLDHYRFGYLESTQSGNLSQEQLDAIELGPQAGESPAGEMTYTWSQLDGTLVEVTDSDSPNLSFIAPDGATELVFQVEVSDGSRTAVDTIVITVEAQETQGSVPGDAGDDPSEQQITEGPESPNPAEPEVTEPPISELPPEPVQEEPTPEPEPEEPTSEPTLEPEPGNLEPVLESDPLAQAQPNVSQDASPEAEPEPELSSGVAESQPLAEGAETEAASGAVDDAPPTDLIQMFEAVGDDEENEEPIASDVLAESLELGDFEEAPWESGEDVANPAEADDAEMAMPVEPSDSEEDTRLATEATENPAARSGLWPLILRLGGIFRRSEDETTRKP